MSHDTAALRDLTREEFEARYDTDRFTATILSNRLRYAVQHVSTGLLYRAFSPVIALLMDFVGAICAPPEQGYRMVSVTNGLTMFLGTIQDGVRTAVEEHGVDRLAPGDLLICNDPSRMGNHPNDLCFIRPIFHQGKIISFMVLRAHFIDMGGITPGGFDTNKHNTYENGLVISPRLLYQAGEPVRETFSLIFDNARFGQMMLPDLETVKGICDMGEELIGQCVDQYGSAAFLGTLRYACDATAERMRSAFEELPDGDYFGEDSIDADGVDADEEYTVKLALRKRGSRVEVDLSGSSRQARTSINGGPLDAKTAIGVGLKELLDPTGEFTSGLFRDIDIVIPAGTIASALPPDGPTFFYWEVSFLLQSVLIRALSDALGEKAVGGDCGSANVHNAYGARADGTPWACSAVAGAETGPAGANRMADGEGHLSPYQVNMLAPAAEALEAEFPLMIMRKEYLEDSCGSGRHRGGASILKDILWRDPARHVSAPLRFRHASGVGVQGAESGRQGGVWIFDREGKEAAGADAFVPKDPDAFRAATPVAGVMDSATNLPDPAGEYRYFGSTPVWETGGGATWRYVNNGGGGWGDPFERTPERVLEDVRDGYVTIDGAARDYGVVVLGDPAHDPEALQVDANATTTLRRTAPPG